MEAKHNERPVHQIGDKVVVTPENLAAIRKDMLVNDSYFLEDMAKITNAHVVGTIIRIKSEDKNSNSTGDFTVKFPDHKGIFGTIPMNESHFTNEALYFENIKKNDAINTEFSPIDLMTTKFAQGPSLMIYTRGGTVIYEAHDIMVTDGEGGYSYESASAHGRDYDSVKKAFWEEIKEVSPDCKVSFRKCITNDRVQMNTVEDMRTMKNIDNLTRTDIVQNETPTPVNVYPLLSQEEHKELSVFTSVIKESYPYAQTECIHKLCGIASDMQKYTIQNSTGSLSAEKFNALTDHQEKQINELIKDLPGVKVHLYEHGAAAVMIEIPPQGRGYTTASYAVPEIPKNKLTIAPVPTKTATVIVSPKR